jgi:hypothetical protein
MADAMSASNLDRCSVSNPARTLQVVTSARQASLAAADRLVNGLDPVPGRLLELRGERLDAGDGCQQKSAEAAAEAMTRGMLSWIRVRRGRRRRRGYRSLLAPRFQPKCPLPCDGRR